MKKLTYGTLYKYFLYKYREKTGINYIPANIRIERQMFRNVVKNAGEESTKIVDRYFDMYAINIYFSIPNFVKNANKIYLSIKNKQSNESLAHVTQKRVKLQAFQIGLLSKEDALRAGLTEKDLEEIDEH